MRKILVFFLLVVCLSTLILIPHAKATTLADSAWPCKGHDSRHTGRSPYIGAQTNTLKWSYQTGARVTSSLAIGTDSTIYVGSWDQKFYALDPEDGNPKWSYQMGENIASTPAIGADGTIYVGCWDMNLYAFAPNGNLKWYYKTDGNIISSPTIGEDGTVYIGNYSDKNFYAIDPNGNFKWKYATGHHVYSSPAIGVDGTIYFGSLDHKLYALDPNGSLKWSYQTGDGISSSPAIGADGTVYFGSDDSNLYALDPNGNLKWSYQTDGKIGHSSPAIGNDGIIYIGSWDKKIYALNSNGSLKWSYETGDNISSSPVIGADGTVYIGSMDRKIYAIDRDGSLKWSYQTDYDVISSPAIGSDGTVYIGSDDKYVYAFDATVFFSTDTTPPEIICPADMLFSAASAPIEVTYTAIVTDNIDPNPLVIYVPASGSEFLLGATEVKITATDSSGNFSICTFTINIGAPEITCPDDIIIRATGDITEVVYIASVIDNTDPDPLIVYNLAPGTGFPIGITEVRVTATNAFGISSTCTFNVTVVEPPYIICPDDMHISATGSQVGVTYTANVTDDLDSDPVIGYDPEPGSIFPIGTTEVIVTATNFFDISNTCTFNVTVIDTDLQKDSDSSGDSSGDSCFITFLVQD